MIEFFRAFVWLRWRVLRNAFRRRGGRDGLERVSRMGDVLVPILLGVVVVPLALALAATAAWAGASLGQKNDEVSTIVFLAARGFLAVNTAVIIIGPVARSAAGSRSSLTRFVLLPIPRRALLTVEILAGIADPWIAVPLPALVAFCAGIAWGGQVGTALLAAIATALLLAVLLALGAALGFVVQLLFRDRRRGEVLTLIGAVVLAFAGFVPMLLNQRMVDRQVGKSAEAREPVAEGRGWGFLAVTQVLPSELWARSIREASDGRPAQALGAMAGLALIGGALLLTAGAAHRRLLESPAEGSARRGARTKEERVLRLPGLSDRRAAVASVQMRFLLRTLTGKLVVFLNPLTVLVLAVILPRAGRHLPLDRLPVHRGIAFAAAGGAFLFFAIQRLMVNQFAADGAGFTLQALLPLSDRDLVWGKLTGIGILGLLSYGIFLALLVPASGGIAPLALLTCLLGAASAYLVFAPIAAILAAIFPKAADLSRLGGASSPHGLAILAGFLAGNSACAPAVGLYVFGAVLLGSPALGCALVAAWLAIACGLSIPLVGIAAATLAARRENIALVAQGR